MQLEQPELSSITGGWRSAEREQKLPAVRTCEWGQHWSSPTAQCSFGLCLCRIGPSATSQALPAPHLFFLFVQTPLP